jgi:4-hydroxy-3-polyprenylbenzoate decarboxylase
MKRVIVGISGASGVIYGIRALELLRRIGGIETHLVLSSAAARTIRAEAPAYSLEDVERLADVRHAHRDIGASIASGSFRTDGMLVAPCSVKTLSAIAHCYTDDLISRAADVQLKERRRLVLLFRETPLHAGHIELMAQATRSGAILMPPVPAFYARPSAAQQDPLAAPRDSLDEAVTQSVGRALDLFGIDAGVVHRWQGQAD